MPPSWCPPHCALSLPRSAPARIAFIHQISLPRHDICPQELTFSPRWTPIQTTCCQCGMRHRLTIALCLTLPAPLGVDPSLGIVSLLWTTTGLLPSIVINQTSPLDHYNCKPPILFVIAHQPARMVAPFQPNHHSNNRLCFASLHQKKGGMQIHLPLLPRNFRPSRHHCILQQCWQRGVCTTVPGFQ
jgi:hypothetical protein